MSEIDTGERPMTQYKVGDRLEDTDPRSEGRIVEIRNDFGGGYYRIQSEVNPKNPSAVGRHTTIHANTLDRHFKKISR